MEFITPRPLTPEKIAAQTREFTRYDVADGDPETNQDIAELSTIRAPLPPPKQPKVFLSSDCRFNCSYCGCRASQCGNRFTHSPAEMAEIAVNTALDHPHHGVFITSAVYRNADYTEELIVETLRRMRFKHHYTGYIHAKIMPGADPALIEEAGWLADRLSVNIELPHSDGYAVIAKQKTRRNILEPMENISRKIREHQGERNQYGRPFARAGQTTQLIVGAMGEIDRTSLRLAEALYKKYRLRRVYYSPFHLHKPGEFDFFPEQSTPTWRTRRLYQADRLMQLYSFTMEELTPEDAPDMQMDLDPKAAWALRHRELFPVELNRADYEMLLRVPGLGVTSAQKIIRARRQQTLTFDLLRQLRVPLSRARYFVTCGGKIWGAQWLDSLNLRQMVADRSLQMSLFDQTFPPHSSQ